MHLIHLSIGNSFETLTNPGAIVIEYETVARRVKDLSFLGNMVCVHLPPYSTSLKLCDFGKCLGSLGFSHFIIKMKIRLLPHVIAARIKWANKYERLSTL